MNIQSFLKPFYEVTLVYDDQNLAEALEIMTEHRYTSIPVINHDQAYVGTLTEGDILQYILHHTECLNPEELKKHFVGEVKRHRDYDPVSVDSLMPTLLSKASHETLFRLLIQMISLSELSHVKHYLIISLNIIFLYYNLKQKKELLVPFLFALCFFPSIIIERMLINELIYIFII